MGTVAGLPLTRAANKGTFIASGVKRAVQPVVDAMAHFLQKDAANGLAGGGQGQPVGLDRHPLTPLRVKGDVGALGPFEFRAARQFNHQAEAWAPQPQIQFDDAAFEPGRVGGCETEGLAQQMVTTISKGQDISMLIHPSNSRVPQTLNTVSQGSIKTFLNVNVMMSNLRLKPLQVFFLFHVGHQSIDPEDIMTARRAS